MKRDERTAKSRHPWRENIEALAMAIVVALLFKSFILEISKIPSGSMQPTLMGNPETEVFDRVVVDKLSFKMRDPRRWEIVVFKHPLEHSRIMVKRLVGMPGEELRIAGGDLWTRPGPDEPWTILRRPREVQEEMWRRLDVDEPLRSSWTRTEGSALWHVEGRSVAAEGAGRVVFRDAQGAIRDHYLDGYPDALRGKIALRPEWGRNHVGDLRLSGRVEAGEDVDEVRLELSEGMRTYAFVLPGPQAGADARPTIRVEGEGQERSVEGEPWHLRAGDRTRFAAINLDDRLALELDGEEVAALEIESVTGRGSGAAIATGAGSARFDDLMVERDIYYTGTRGSTWETNGAIPPEHYVMLGDNTQDSADSRDWEAVRFTWRDAENEERTARGNFRGSNENPTRNAALGLTRFRDEWGEPHWFSTADGRQGLQAPAPLVPRELIQGRALAVFWPIKPHRGLWRLAWLH